MKSRILSSIPSFLVISLFEFLAFHFISVFLPILFHSSFANENCNTRKVFKMVSSILVSAQYFWLGSLHLPLETINLSLKFFKFATKNFSYFYFSYFSFYFLIFSFRTLIFLYSQILHSRL